MAHIEQFKTLPRPFYLRDTVAVAKDLLGKLLIRLVPAGRMTGRIVEVEAYKGSDDPASHAYRGPTPRNEVMFGPGGFAYIYFTYGMHHCLNVTAEPKGTPGAVLIRALEPLEGIELMMGNRRAKRVSELANGPAKLTQAFQITRKLNGADLTVAGELFISEGPDRPREIASSPRIGVTDPRPWRFFIKDMPYPATLS